MLKQRQILRLMLTMVTVAAAGASVATGSLSTACGMALCALATVAVPFERAASDSEVTGLLESLRVARTEGAPAVNAVVGSRVIFIGRSAIAGEPVRGYALLLRDEIEAPAWRELVTLLRHQVRTSPELDNVDRNAAFPLGKPSDL